MGKTCLSIEKGVDVLGALQAGVDKIHARNMTTNETHSHEISNVVEVCLASTCHQNFGRRGLYTIFCQPKP